MRIMTFREIKSFGGRRLPAVIEMVPLNKEGRKTVIHYKNIRFDEKIDKNVFTLRNLQKRR